MGTVRVPAGLDFMHRGIFRVTTTQTDFVTDPSKTYHLRWNPTDGFVLRDLASGAYNPGSLAEMNPVFDSTYDDMLVARVITNMSNVATVTNLVNRDRLTAAVLRTETFTRTTDANGNILSPFGAEALNWARTPAVTGLISRYGYSTMLQRVPEDPIMLLSGSAMDGSGTATASASRYAIAPVGVVDTNLPATSFTFSYQISLMCQG